jgi:hypothetical protein
MWVYVPTPFAFECDDPSIHEAYLAKEYPPWEYKAYLCEGGRYV